MSLVCLNIKHKNNHLHQEGELKGREMSENNKRNSNYNDVAVVVEVSNDSLAKTCPKTSYSQCGVLADVRSCSSLTHLNEWRIFTTLNKLTYV
ncbi:hypothetical protein P5673_031118 [Acropora cervicornis]|uniref:Uncharacterized protein n=1 Tax=Acropora cervicornis TaxID=6130 RepID=A0AAD9UT48_ACRCE|nr:hypothetical protein P5673_031118 [Acropora cervicornis]